MRATNIRIEETPRGAALCADVSFATSAFDPCTLWVEFVGLPLSRLIPNGDAFVPALLWSAMKLGEPLAIEAGISTELLENLPAIQIISQAWIPGLQQIPVEVQSRASLPVIPGGALFFSCGIDSFYSLLKHRSSFTHLICVQGFDMNLEENEPFSRLFSATRDVAREMGLTALEVRTNIRTLIDRFFRWADIFASGLAAVGLSAQGCVGKCTFATDCDYSHLTPRGTHPALDHLWSAENLRIIHDGYELTRLEKVRRVAEMDLAMRYLRVCLVDPVAYNCGQCEKCIRTMLELHAIGALDRCKTLPSRISPKEVAQLRIPSATALGYYQDLQRVLGDSGTDSENASALRRAVRTYKLRQQYRALRGLLDRFPAGAGLGQGLDRAKALLSEFVR